MNEYNMKLINNCCKHTHTHKFSDHQHLNKKQQISLGFVMRYHEIRRHLKRLASWSDINNLSPQVPTLSTCYALRIWFYCRAKGPSEATRRVGLKLHNGNPWRIQDPNKGQWWVYIDWSVSVWILYFALMLVYLSSLYELGLICNMWRIGKDEHYIFSTCRLESSLPLLIKQHFATPLASWLERQKLIQGSLWHPALPRWLVLSAMTTSQLSKVWAKNSEWLRNQLASWLQLLQLDSWLGQTTNICQTPHLLEEFALWSLRLRIWSALNELEPPWVCQPSQWNWPQAQLA